MRKITIKDIAELAGVSKATVSMVLNKKDNSIGAQTRERILKLAEDMNYIPNSIARSLSTKKTGTIGIILPDITNPFFAEIARAIEDSANNFGYNVIFCNSDNSIEKEQKYIELLIGKLVDGVVFISGGKSSKSLKKLDVNGTPFVLVDRYVDDFAKYPGVYCLNGEGIIKGIDYLHNSGRRKIALVSGPFNLEISSIRIKAYKEAMKKHDIYDESLIFESDFTLNGGKVITKSILQNNKEVDAIFYCNDIMAVGGLKVMLRKGYKIPKDISIIGFDNIGISEVVEPELTTIGQPIYDMGKEACRLLVDIIEEKEIKEKIIYFKPELIKRATV